MDVKKEKNHLSVTKPQSPQCAEYFKTGSLALKQLTFKLKQITEEFQPFSWLSGSFDSFTQRIGVKSSYMQISVQGQQKLTSLATL